MINIHDIILFGKEEEDIKTTELFIRFSNIRQQGFLDKSQSISILIWKSPRPLMRYRSNPEEDFVEFTRHAFKTGNERLRIHTLTALKGVAIPAASAILMFWDKEIYPVIDIRVWQVLYLAGLVQVNPRGQGFTLSHWDQYLQIIRNLSTTHHLSARQIEKRIFEFHRANQVGNLYY